MHMFFQISVNSLLGWISHSLQWCSISKIRVYCFVPPSSFNRVVSHFNTRSNSSTWPTQRKYLRLLARSQFEGLNLHLFDSSLTWTQLHVQIIHQILTSNRWQMEEVNWSQLLSVTTRMLVVGILWQDVHYCLMIVEGMKTEVTTKSMVLSRME